MKFLSTILSETFGKPPEFKDISEFDTPRKAGGFTSLRPLLKCTKAILQVLPIRKDLGSEFNGTVIYDLPQTLRLIKNWYRDTKKTPFHYRLRKTDKIEKIVFYPWAWDYDDHQVMETQFLYYYVFTINNSATVTYDSGVNGIISAPADNGHVGWEIRVVRVGNNEYRGYIERESRWLIDDKSEPYKRKDIGGKGLPEIYED